MPLIMAAHATYPAIDARRIASQSPRVLRRLLRERMKFGGVVVTDALEADAVTRRSSVAIAAERSVRAGADLLLLSRASSYRAVFRRLLREGRRSLVTVRHRLRVAVARVLVLKRFTGLPVPAAGDLAVNP